MRRSRYGNEINFRMMEVDDDEEGKVRRLVEVVTRAGKEEEVSRFLNHDVSLCRLLSFAAERAAGAASGEVNPHIARSALRIVLSSSAGVNRLDGEALQMFLWGLSSEAVANVRIEALKCIRILLPNAEQGLLESLIESVAKAVVSDDVGVSEAACEAAAALAERDIDCYTIARTLTENQSTKVLHCLDAGCRSLVLASRDQSMLIQDLVMVCGWEHDPLSRLVVLELIKKTATEDKKAAEMLCCDILIEPLLVMAEDTEDPFATSEHALAALAELVIGADAKVKGISRLLAITLSRLSDDNQYQVAALEAVARLAKANETEVLLNPELADAWLRWPQNEASAVRLARLEALKHVFSSSKPAAAASWSKLRQAQIVPGIVGAARNYAKSEAVAIAGIDTLAAAVTNAPDALDTLLLDFTDFYAWLVSDESPTSASTNGPSLGGGALFTPPIAHAKYRLLCAVSHKSPTPFNSATAKLIADLVNQGPFRPSTRPATFLVADA